jgi:hypothetical protein
MSHARIHFWGNLAADLLGWRRKDWYISDSYAVCDFRDTGGNLELVHIDGHTAKDIRKQLANIIQQRKS